MAIITLTSDWGMRSHYVGAVKGCILKRIPQAQIVDITHQIKPFDIMQGSFILKNAFPNFPAGTIHIVGINTEAGQDTPHILVEYQDMFFLGADNGIFSLIFDEEKPRKIIELDLMQDSDYFTFSSRDVFVKAAAMLAAGKKPEELGSAMAALRERMAFKPAIHKDKIVGKVIFIDDYENVFVNIDQKTFRQVGKGRNFTISFRTPGYDIHTLKTAYSDVIEGERLALFSSTGFLEIAINKGNASGLLGLHLQDTVTIDFEL